ncbi:ABC transporter substrate-binding protein [Mycobacterium sp. SMC-4]|nr:ABC transporter substrate-binding protein [Mycobacterium sp. SMC-4]
MGEQFNGVAIGIPMISEQVVARSVPARSPVQSFSRNPVLGAKANAGNYHIEIGYERTYSLDTEDFVPVIDAVADSSCDVLFLCSYLDDSVSLVRTISAHRYRPTLVGGAMIGLQNTAVKAALGSLLNGFVTTNTGCRYPRWRFRVFRSCSPRTRVAPLTQASTCSGTTWRRWPMPSCRSSPKPSKRPVVLMTPNCRSTPAARCFTP